MSRTLRLKIEIPAYCETGGEIIDLVEAFTASLGEHYRFRKLGTITEECELERNGRTLACEWSVSKDES